MSEMKKEMLILAGGLGALAAAGFALYQVNNAVAALGTINPNYAKCSTKGEDVNTKLFVLVTPNADPKEAPTVDPQFCHALPGQIVQVRFGTTKSFALSFGKDGATPGSEATPDENFGVAFNSTYATGQDNNLYFKMGPAAVDCNYYPFRVQVDNSRWEANPSIIIKPGTNTVCADPT